MPSQARLLAQAIDDGEGTIPHVLRALQLRREKINAVLRSPQRKLCFDDALKARQQVCELTRLMSRFLNLPREKPARGRALEAAFEAMLQLRPD